MMNGMCGIEFETDPGCRVCTPSSVRVLSARQADVVWMGVIPRHRARTPSALGLVLSTLRAGEWLWGHVFRPGCYGVFAATTPPTGAEIPARG